MARRGGVTDFLLSPFVRVRERGPAARLFIWHQTLMPERNQSHFHVEYSMSDECPRLRVGIFVE